MTKAGLCPSLQPFGDGITRTGVPSGRRPVLKSRIIDSASG